MNKSLKKLRPLGRRRSADRGAQQIIGYLDEDTRRLQPREAADSAPPSRRPRRRTAVGIAVGAVAGLAFALTGPALAGTGGSSTDAPHITTSSSAVPAPVSAAGGRTGGSAAAKLSISTAPSKSGSAKPAVSGHTVSAAQARSASR